MEQLLQIIESEVRRTYQKSIEDITNGILTDFQNEVKDPKINEVLQRIVDIWVTTDIDLEDSPQKPAVVKVSPRQLPDAKLSVSDLKLPEIPVIVKAAPGTCPVLLKSGSRANQPCGATLKGNNTACQKHLPRSASGLTCEMIMKSGARKGTMCGKSVASGYIYCSVHTCNGCVFKEGKKCGRPISPFSPSGTICNLHLPTEIPFDKKNLVVSINKAGQKEHKYTGFVFNEENKAYGKAVAGGSVDQNFTNDDFELVRIYGIPLVADLVPKMAEYISSLKK